MDLNFKAIYNQISGNRFIGISVYLTEDGFYVFGCEVNRVNDEFRINKQFSFSNSFNELVSLVDSTYPIVLQIDGKGVVHKKTNEKDITDEFVGKIVFPGLNLSDFFVQLKESSQNDTFISICKKTQILELISQLKENDFHTVDVSLGPFSISPFLSDISCAEDFIQVSDYSIELVNNSITNLTKINSRITQKYQFQDEEVDGDILVSYCAVLHYYVYSHIETKSEVSTIIYNMQRQVKFKRYFLALAFLGPLLLFVFLLGNFWLYASYSGKFENVNLVYSQNKEILEQLSDLEDDFSARQIFAANNSFNISSADVKFCDRIAFSLNKGIELTKMEINPILLAIKKEKQILYQPETILIEGEALDESVLRKWIDKLDYEEWINEVKIVKFIHEENKPLYFGLKIKYTI